MEQCADKEQKRGFFQTQKNDGSERPSRHFYVYLILFLLLPGISIR
jgi:hypothetical protein